MTTIILPISRPDYLDAVFASLEFLECDKDNTNLLAIVDGNPQLYETARNRVEMSKFNDRLCVQYKTKDKMKNYDLAHRRLRIANIHNFAKQFIKKSEYIFTTEDDTSFGINTLNQLLRDYLILPYAGLIQGYQVGRHGINHYGVWEADKIYNPTEIKSQPKQEGLQECSAGGFYCMLTKAENYMAHDFKPFGNVDLGPDVEYGLALREQGYKNYTDWSLPCQHHTKDEIIDPRTAKIQQVRFLKVENRWRQKTL